MHPVQSSIRIYLGQSRAGLWQAVNSLSLKADFQVSLKAVTQPRSQGKHQAETRQPSSFQLDARPPVRLRVSVLRTR